MKYSDYVLEKVLKQKSEIQLKKNNLVAEISKNFEFTYLLKQKYFYYFITVIMAFIFRKKIPSILKKTLKMILSSSSFKVKPKKTK